MEDAINLAVHIVSYTGNCAELKPVHEDGRRAISELNLADSSIQSFVIKQADLPLGNHYHEKKAELFIITKGSGRVYLYKLGKLEKHKDPLELKKGSVVVVPKYTAHTFILEPGSEMLCLSSAPFNEEDKDMIPYKIEF